MSDESERVTVSTYVPEYQREQWREHAQDLGMSQSEFVRTMVQAGRRGFATGEDESDPEEADPPGSNPGGNEVKMAVQEILRDRGPLSWDELVEELAGDLEERLDVALDELQAGNRVQHSGRQGGYVLAEAADVD